MSHIEIILPFINTVNNRKGGFFEDKIISTE
jgi:hypothetical protein